MSEQSGGELQHPADGITRLVEKSVYEQMPFREPAVRSFMREWCAVNDSIRPEFVDRTTWNTHRETGLLQPREDGMKTLYMTEDMQLPEMIDVVKTIDQDTFPNDPDKAREHGDKLKQLGKTFRNAGIYIAQRLDGIYEGHVLAESTAMDFYSYGESLLMGTMLDETPVVDMVKHQLTEQEMETVDKWLAGDELYTARMKSVERRLTYNEDPSQADTLREYLIEETRRNTLAQYFRTADKSLRVLLDRDSDAASGDEVDIAFIANHKRQVQRQIEAPNREVDASIMRRGMELLNKTMGFDRLKDEVDVILAKRDAGEELTFEEEQMAGGLIGVFTSFENWRDSETTLREGLRIDDLRDELAKLRASGDKASVGRREEEITSVIQQAVSAFPYEDLRSNPSEIIAQQSLNCVGASLLAGTFLSELGINYLVADSPGHSTLLVVTTDDDVFYHDMLHPNEKYGYPERVINGKKSDDQPITLQDIIQESRQPTDRVFELETGEDFFSVSHPRVGYQRQVMNNASVMLDNLGRHDEAAIAFRKSKELRAA